MEFYRNGFKYVVEWDDADHYFNDEYIEQEDKDHLQRQIDGGYGNFFSVVEYKQCGECDQWHVVDSLYGIYAISEGDALESYLEMHGLKAVEA